MPNGHDISYPHSLYPPLIHGPYGKKYRIPIRQKVHKPQGMFLLYGPTLSASGKPSFLEGGNPKLEAQQYWQAVRRAVLRSPVERIGLGGYLHLVESKPDFVEYIAEMADEFRMIKKLHEGGKPFCFRPVVGVLHHWGSRRAS